LREMATLRLYDGEGELDPLSRTVHV
jgi:hypothetical protein